LLSNAFKFTPEGGEIKVLANIKDEAFVEISIRDNGTGIPKENISKIFDRFYQVDGSHTRKQEGTGIGLSLTKELVELHKGKIEVESEEGKGTTFTISIPLGKKHLKAEEICETYENEVQYNSQKSVNIVEREIELPRIDLISDTGNNNNGNPILLIVEDNSDIRNYIKSILEKNYKIFEAIDGEDGWNKSVENIPDLIISDVMMPKMDGFQLCNKLKTDERTSHIPVILLTAKAAKQDKIEGFETGADEYIMKPFETDELKARIKNLIDQRKRLHEHFRKHGIFEIEESRFTSADKKFLKKVFNTITENISDPSFNVEVLSELIAVSRSVLHKKIVSLTGEPPVELIRRIRLTKGAELIEKKFGNISEIAFEVGFNNPAHFSEYFKKQFGVTPSQYLNKETRRLDPS
jgi:DNA-binding response OmpR family regulator/anti-sigma regulatory factor (Ser/Thr protein kinase)